MERGMIINSDFLIPTELYYKALYIPWCYKDDDDDDNNNWIPNNYYQNSPRCMGEVMIKNNSVTWWYHIPLLQEYLGNEAVNQLR